MPCAFMKRRRGSRSTRTSPVVQNLSTACAASRPPSIA